MNTKTKTIFSGFILSTLCLFILSLAFPAEAANPYGRHGWVTPVESIDGDDDVSCGPNEVALTLEVRDRDTNALIDPHSVIVAVFDTTQNPRVLVDNIVSSNSRTGPICWNPDIHSVAYDVNGGATHYNFYSSFVDSKPGVMPRQKAATGVVWLTSVGNSHEYHQVYPSPTSVTIASSSPAYTYAINHVHDAYGATGMAAVNLFVFEYDPNLSTYTDTAVSKYLNQSGGVGNKTIPAETLADGWYGWSLYLHLNRDHNAGHGVIAERVSKSGFLNTWHPFVLDTTPPDIVASHAPLAPTTEQAVTLSVNANDSLTGVVTIDVYLNGSLLDSCFYASVFSAACEVDANLLPLGTHEYYAVARDTAGNTATSDVYEITVIPPMTATDPLSCAVPNATILDTAQAWSGSSYAGLQAMQKVGDYIFTGGAGGSNVQGLYIYDVSNPEDIQQVSFFSTYNPEEVRNNSFGNDVLGLDVVGNYAYLATYYGGLVIVDVSNPSSPTYVGKIPLYNLNTPGSKETWGVEVVGNHAYLAAGRGLHVVDVSNKTNPTLVANLNLGASISQGLTLSGNYAYIVLRGAGVRVVDITDPTNPVQVGSVTDGYYPGYPDGSWAYSADVKGDYLYVADHLAERISVFSIADPANPIRVRTVAVPGDPDHTAPDSPRVVRVVGDVLYAGAGRYGIYTFDITDPANPTQIYNVTKPPLSSGTYAWDVLPLNSGDFLNVVFVSYDTNAVVTLGVTCEPLPNLNAITPTIAPGSVAPGEQITISAEIENTGPVIAGPYNVLLYVDTNGDDVHEYELPIERVETDTGSGVSQTLNIVWTVPSDAPVGNNYRVGYFADVNNEVDEGDGDGEYANWSGWSDSFTVAVADTPYLNGSGCEIPVGGSFCFGSFTWDVAGEVNPNLYNSSTNEVCSTDASRTDESCLLSYGDDQLMQLRSGATVLDEEFVSVSCESPAVWNGTTCGDSAVSLTADPTLVAVGGDTELRWITPSIADFCTASGGWSGPKAASGGTETVTNITTDTTYSLTCQWGGGGGSDTATVAVIMPADGSCNASTNGQAFYPAPADGTLCSVGNPRWVDSSANDGIYEWVCEGTDGGDDVPCSAARIPDVSLEAVPDIIRRGQQTEVVTTINASWEVECTVLNASSSPITIDHFGTDNPNQDYPHLTRNLFATQVVTVSCRYPEPDFTSLPPLLTETRIEVVPNLQEL